MTWEMCQGDVLERLREMPDESVHCVVTSPPFWGLRDYGCDGQLGLEGTPEEYVAKMVEVFREVKRVLRSDGTCWLNLGDSYGVANNRNSGVRQVTVSQNTPRDDSLSYNTGTYRRIPGLKPKDLVGIPWRVAFALQADGWWLRSDIIWAKPNPMPESVTDRPTKAHEYVFLLTKSARYFYDADAVATVERWGQWTERVGEPTSAVSIAGASWCGTNPAGANRRTVWTITTKPYAEAHFATFPPELPEICIKAGTSEQGCCAECGAPWERVVERQSLREVLGERDTTAENVTGRDRAGISDGMSFSNSHDGPRSPRVTTTGWCHTCDHEDEPVPCTVLDPFAGSGTTLMVALRLGRDAIGIELNPEYVRMAENRIDDDCPLFNRQLT